MTRLRAAWLLPLLALLVACPEDGRAQAQEPGAQEPGGSAAFREFAGIDQFWSGVGSDARDRYLYGTLALGVPSAVVSAMNLAADAGTDRMWLGLAGIGLGVGHGALFVAGLGQDRAVDDAAVWWNAIASAYSTVSGILQVRSTIGDGPDPSSFRASVTPRIDGLRLRMTWKPAR